MKEKELRERIEQFLRKAARNVVVPASVGLGLSVSGCDQHALHVKAADAGGDLAAQVSDVAKVSTSEGCLSLPSARHGETRFVEGNLRTTSLRAIWNRAAGFAYNRGFHPEQLRGFCRVCRYGDVCRGGCMWKRYSLNDETSGDMYCFYFQAMKHGRHDLLEDEPTEAEHAYFAGCSGCAPGAAAGTLV